MTTPGTLAAWLACVGTLLPTAALASDPETKIADVALGTDGLLIGQVVDPAGTPQANTKVAILHQDQIVAETKSDDNGVFVVRGLRGGVYAIKTAESTTAVRAWAPHTAPPSARPSTLVVQGQQVFRGVPASGALSYIPGGRTGLGIGLGIATIAAGLDATLADEDWDNS